MLLCALDSRCNLELYQQNLRNWYFNRKYTGENIEFDIDQVTQKAIMKNFRGVSSDSNSGNRSLMGCCVLAFSPLSKEEIFSFIKITHNSRYSFKYTWFFIEFIRCLLEYEDKEQALQQAEQRCPARLLPALRQTARPGCGISPCFQALSRDRPPAARGAVLLPLCRRGRSAPLCATLRAFMPVMV